MAWLVKLDRSAEKELDRLDPQAARRILSFLFKRLRGSDDPRSVGEALAGELSGLWRYRIGDYRLICAIQDSTITVLVLKIAHRSKAYR